MEPVPRWEHFEHMADIGVRGVGTTLAEAFEQIGLALTAVIAAPERVHGAQAVAIRCGSRDVELLLFAGSANLRTGRATDRRSRSRAQR